MTVISGQIGSTQVIDASIEDVRNKKNNMASTMDSVISLVREVECEEKSAEEAKLEAAYSTYDVLIKVDQLQRKQKDVKNTNEMLAREANVQKELLASKIEVLELRVGSLMEKGDRSLELLDEMHNALKKRLSSALMEKELAKKRKQENETFARITVTHEELQLAKVEEESKRLKREAVEISKLQEFLIDRDNVIQMLHEEISDKCQNVKLLKAELDKVVPPGGIMSSNQSLTSFKPSDSNLFVRKSLVNDSVDKHVETANNKQIKSGELSQLVNEKVISDIKNSDFGENSRDVNKLHGNEMFGRNIKKVKIRGKLNGNKMFAKITKKVKIKGMKKCAKNIMKVKIKGIQHGIQMVAKTKSVGKTKIKGRYHGNLMVAKNIKKVKIKKQTLWKSNVRKTYQ